MMVFNDPSFLGVQDVSLIGATDKLFSAWADYSSSIAKATGMLPNPVDIMVPELRPGMFRSDVERALPAIEAARAQLKTTLEFDFERAIRDETDRINDILEAATLKKK